MPRSVLAAISTRLRALRYSYLALPGVVALAFAALAIALTAVGRALGPDAVGGIFPAGPDAARSLLSTIAASLITVAGLAFSITVVSLQLVSQQFTPRALRGFLGDRLNQTVAGVFVGVFVYCLIVMRSIGDGGQPFIAGISVTVAVGLAVVALAMLLVFINHMAQSIQVSSIAGTVAHQTLAALETLYPERYGEAVDDDADLVVAGWRASEEPALVYPNRPGFVQSLDDVPGTLSGGGFRIELLVSPGDFVTEEHPLAAVWTDGQADDCARALRRAVFVADERDLRQDAAYGVRQLADIAVKALSPSVNDPTTATTCIGYLQAIVERVGGREWPAALRRFPDRDVTIAFRRNTFADFLEPFVQIGRYATDARVVHALINALLRVAESAERAGQQTNAAAAAECGRRIGERALAGDSLDAEEREAVERLLEKLARAVGSDARPQALAGRSPGG